MRRRPEPLAPPPSRRIQHTHLKAHRRHFSLFLRGMCKCVVCVCVCVHVSTWGGVCGCVYVGVGGFLVCRCVWVCVCLCVHVCVFVVCVCSCGWGVSVPPPPKKSLPWNSNETELLTCFSLAVQTAQVQIFHLKKYACSPGLPVWGLGRTKWNFLKPNTFLVSKTLPCLLISLVALFSVSVSVSLSLSLSLALIPFQNERHSFFHLYSKSHI